MVIIPDGCAGFSIPASPYEGITATGIANPATPAARSTALPTTHISRTKITYW
jgi:hypothetical protein